METVFGIWLTGKGRESGFALANKPLAKADWQPPSYPLEHPLVARRNENRQKSGKFQAAFTKNKTNRHFFLDAQPLVSCSAFVGREALGCRT